MDKFIQEINANVLPSDMQLYHISNNTYKSKCGILIATINNGTFNLDLNERTIINSDTTLNMKNIRATIMRRIRTISRTDESYIQYLDMFSHGTYSPEYLVKILNDGYFQKQPLKYTSIGCFENAEYTIYSEFNADGTTSYVINYRTYEICKITSYADLLNANSLMRSAMIKHCNMRINQLENRIGQYNIIKEGLLNESRPIG